MWIFIYNLDKNSTVIETKEYFEMDDDMFPAMSLCFNQLFDDRLFTKYEENITGNAYKDFLFGNHFDEKFTKIDFYDVTMNLSDFFLGTTVGFRNGT